MGFTVPDVSTANGATERAAARGPVTRTVARGMSFGEPAGLSHASSSATIGTCPQPSQDSSRTAGRGAASGSVGRGTASRNVGRGAASGSVGRGTVSRTISRNV